MSLQQGQVIAGKYRLNAVLGTGGMAAVWSATNVFTERQFAIKFLLPTFARTPEAAKRFLMEAKVSGRVQHPNVIEIIDVGQAEDASLFLVMELLTGDSLEHALRHQRPPMKVVELLAVLMDVARAMSAAHRAGVVHRDLKPTNVILHKNRTGVAVPKILDFGVSKFLLEADRDNSLTIAGTVMGSPLYMSPEQARGQLDVDHRTDVYAFGAILFEALCGYRCYDAPNFNALIVAIATTEPKSIDHCAPGMPPSLRALVRDCLATDKNKRLESFDAVIARLQSIQAELAQSEQRLPEAMRRPGDVPLNPESTAALPAIIRPGDVPTPPPSAPNPKHTEQQASAAPWAGSLPGYRATSPKPPIALLAIAGGVFMMMVLAVGTLLVLIVRHRGHTADDQGIVAVAPTASDEATPQPSVSASDEVPVVSIDDLPSKGHLRMGKLTVESGPLACTVSIDGKVRGSTPVLGLDVATGGHLVRCETTAGVLKSSGVSVVEGQTAHVHFSTNP